MIDIVKLINIPHVVAFIFLFWMRVFEIYSLSKFLLFSKVLSIIIIVYMITTLIQLT